MRSATPSRMPAPTANYAGSNPERQSVGDPGHCEDCALLGHVAAHPDLGCGDVGCHAHHADLDNEASPDSAASPHARSRAVPPVRSGSVVARTPRSGALGDYGTVVTGPRDGVLLVTWLGALEPAPVLSADVEVLDR